jgi:transposase
MIAVCQVRGHQAGRDYYGRKLTEGKTDKEAMRALKRRLSDIVYRHMVSDANQQPIASV